MSRFAPPEGIVEGSRHYLPIRVYWEDTDVGGVVYHANYLKYFERARSDLLRVSGTDHVDLMASDEPLIFVIRKAYVDYFSSAKLDDVLEVETCLTKLGGASMDFLQILTAMAKNRIRPHSCRNGG